MPKKKYFSDCQQISLSLYFTASIGNLLKLEKKQKADQYLADRLTSIPEAFQYPVDI
jgi:hypothetical protein